MYKYQFLFFCNWCSLHIHVSGLCSCSDHTWSIVSTSRVFTHQKPTLWSGKAGKEGKGGSEKRTDVWSKGAKTVAFHLWFFVLKTSLLAQHGRRYCLVGSVPPVLHWFYFMWSAKLHKGDLYCLLCHSFLNWFLHFRSLIHISWANLLHRCLTSSY